MCQRSYRVAVVQANCSERPILCGTPAERIEVGLKAANHFTFGRVFFDRKRQQMGNEKIAIAKLPGHACLHVSIISFRLQRDFVYHFALGIDLK